MIYVAVFSIGLALGAIGVVFFNVFLRRAPKACDICGNGAVRDDV